MEAAKSRRVDFSGSEVIEFDADLPPVVRFAGVCASQNAASLALESEARGLQAASIQQQYVEELRHALRVRGFDPLSDELRELQTQLRVVELLLLWVAGAHKGRDEDVLDPRTLRRAQLAKKQLEGRVDDGYAFGRRFLSISTYVDTLSREELLTAAQQRGVQLPTLDATQRAAVKAPDRELLTAEGRSLRALTLRQLVTEADARGLQVDKTRDGKGKKSKRAWVDVLRPVLAAEVRASKIREQEEELLREKLVDALEREKEKEQCQRVVQLIEQVLKDTEAGGVDGGCAEPEDATLGEEEELDKRARQVDATRRYLEVLVKTVCEPSEAQEDVAMEE
ncbi:hypothetical protein PRNP1_010985 [Phytophthora ramorum]